MDFDTGMDRARNLDAQDELASFRDRFIISDPDLIYLDGNSLGRLPKAAVAIMRQAIEHDWGERLIRLWNDGWVHTPSDLGAKIAGLIGARADEVLVTEATTTNLFKLAVAALRAREDRAKILSDVFNFPSDLYVFQGIIDLLGGHHRLELVPSGDGLSIHPDDLYDRLDADTALLSLTHVAFKSAFRYDMAQVTARAHQAGALTLWDLSHSAGAVPVALNQWNVDLAVGCTYKYLNGGPGAPAFLYVRKDLQTQLVPPTWGWFGAQAPFDFELEFKPSNDISRFRIGTPPMLSMKAIEPGLDLHLEAGIDRLWEKSIRQSEYLIGLARSWLLPLGFSLGSPLDPAQRGSHVSLRHPEAYRISRAMIESTPPAVRVIPDFRTPDNIRLGIAPIYTTFSDIHRALDRMRVIIQEKIFEKYPQERLQVT
ncbi:MAG: kynureninase [Anaerolineales bacterium]|nr:kynureninase [Anaerolineales bacterium]